jgi:multidrug efflux pump subunit AcrB
MGIVRFALKFPHTFYVVAALILFLGVTAAVEMPTDIFPEIDIPVGIGDLAVHRPQHD